MTMLPKIEVPTEVRALAEKSIDHVEQAFELFFASAHRSLPPASSMSPDSLTLSEQNLKAALRQARNLVYTTELQQLMQLQSEFMKGLLANAQQQLELMSSITKVPNGEH
jgi:hypothetical protein